MTSTEPSFANYREVNNNKKEDNKVWLVDVAVSGDSRNEEKELNKIAKYKEDKNSKRKQR